jgi:hypothetical protein
MTRGLRSCVIAVLLLTTAVIGAEGARANRSPGAQAAAQSGRVYAIDYIRGLRYKPKTLPEGAHGLYVGLRWRRWGQSRAFGRGWLDYADRTTHFRVRIRIVLSLIRSCSGRRAYRRFKMQSVHGGTDRRRVRPFAGTRHLRCP